MFKDAIDHFRNALRWSLDGLRVALRGELAFRWEAAATIPLLPLALWLGDSGMERALLVGGLCAVLVVELLNTALEAAVDRHGAERHPLAKQAKDCASAAVFMTLIGVVLIWALVLLS